MIEWYKIADAEAALAFGEKDLITLEVGGKTICIAKQEEGLRACAAKCPHDGGTMSDGYIDAMNNIVCPLHRYKFSLLNGRNVSGEGYFLKTYPVETRPDGIYIGIAGNKLFEGFK